MWASNIETEFKVLWVWHKEIEQNLFELWAKKIFDWVLTAIFYGQNTIIDGQEKYIEIRVRSDWDIVIVENKKQIFWNGNWKVMQEAWFETKSMDDVCKFFESIWFNKIRQSIKQRVSYLINNNNESIQFDFDKYSDLDWMETDEFLEIEWNEELIYEYAKKLGISEYRLLNWWAKELSDYYKQQQWKI